MTLPTEQALAPAKFKAYKGAAKNAPLLFEAPVQFNPASLQYTVSNTVNNEGKGKDKKQYVTQSSAKLTMDLVFDTSDTGVDVRKQTNLMVGLMMPINEGKEKQIPPVVEFDWGLYSFRGIVEQYRETIDFFAASGVPLRASINLTLASLKVVLAPNTSGTSNVDGQQSPTVVVPQAQGAGGGPAAVANQLGDPQAARAIAGLNGSASLRFGGGGELALNAEVSLEAAAAFSAGGGIGAGAGLSFGGGLEGGLGASLGGGFEAGIGGGLSGGIGLGFEASVEIGLTGGGLQASLEVGNPFAGLRSGVATQLSMPDASDLFSGSFNAGTGGQFGLGGQAQTGGGSSLSADVGVDADLTARLQFS